MVAVRKHADTTHPSELLSPGPLLLVVPSSVILPAPATLQSQSSALAIAALSETQRKDLGDMLTELTERVHVATSPLVVDLRDDTLDEAVTSAARAYKPLMLAVASLSRTAWQDESLHVSRVDPCPVDALCFRPLAPAGPSKMERDARMLAWAWSHAVLLHSPDERAHELAAEALQERALQPESTLAAVFTARAFARQDTATTEAARALRDVLPKRADAAMSPELTWLYALAEGQRAHPPMPLSPGDLLVVLRASAIARTPEADAEIDVALRTSGGMWTWSARRQRATLE